MPPGRDILALLIAVSQVQRSNETLCKGLGTVAFL